MKKTETLDTLAWWKYGHVWLVIAGPAVVIVACMVTIWLAVTRPDPVLADDYYRRDIHVDQTVVDPPAGGRALAPAVQARNHAATPALAR